MGARTCCGDCRATSRSCCKVRSTEECFWKFWRALEGPHKASAMADILLPARWKMQEKSRTALRQERVDIVRDGGTGHVKAPGGNKVPGPRAVAEVGCTRPQIRPLGMFARFAVLTPPPLLRLGQLPRLTFPPGTLISTNSSPTLANMVRSPSYSSSGSTDSIQAQVIANSGHDDMIVRRSSSLHRPLQQTDLR